MSLYDAVTLVWHVVGSLLPVDDGLFLGYVVIRCRKMPNV